MPAFMRRSSLSKPLSDEKAVKKLPGINNLKAKKRDRLGTSGLEVTLLRDGCPAICLPKGLQERNFT